MDGRSRAASGDVAWARVLPATLDDWLPDPAVRTHHRRRSAAGPERLWAAANELRLDDTRTLGRVVRWRIPGIDGQQTFGELLSGYPFCVLDEGEHWSISGLAGQKRQAAYGPAKFVATGLTKHLAVEWADRGIRVNAVAPGTIRTERVMQLPDEPGGSEYLAAIEQMHPMGRLGEPAEVASAIVFLASDDASFITGAVLPVDGGFLAQ